MRHVFEGIDIDWPPLGKHIEGKKTAAIYGHTVATPEECDYIMFAETVKLDE